MSGKASVLNVIPCDNDVCLLLVPVLLFAVFSSIWPTMDDTCAACLSCSL